MAIRQIGVFLSATLIATALFSVSADQAYAKSSKARKHSPGSYFVPPPPPYAPSILPERLVRSSAVAEQPAEEVVKAPENPYAKYIFTRDAENMPRVVQPSRQISYRPRT